MIIKDGETTAFVGTHQKCKSDEFLLRFEEGKFILEKMHVKITGLKQGNLQSNS